MSDLRDRIAAVVDKRYTDEAVGHTWEVCLMAADAVIAELNLSVSVEYSSVDGSRRNYMLAGHYTVKADDDE